MSDTLKVFGHTYSNLEGIKAIDDNGNIITFTSDSTQSGIINTLTSDFVGVLTEGYYQVPNGYVANVTYVARTIPQLIYNWDLTNSLTDTIDGSVITLSGATQNSNGVTLSETNHYATIPVKYRPYHSYEFDIGDITLGTLDTHGRLIMPTGNEGLIYRSGTNWNAYLNGGWGTQGSSDATYLANSTLTMVVENSAPRFYVDGVLWRTESRVQSLTNNTNIMIGSSQGQSFRNVTITGVRVYEGIKYS